MVEIACRDFYALRLSTSGQDAPFALKSRKMKLKIFAQF